MSETANTKDAFLNGAFHALQPAKGGHRSGVDALLVASLVPKDVSGKVADLGAGCGVAGLAVAHRVPACAVDLVENEPNMVELARKTLKLPDNSALSPRISVIEADILAKGEERSASGLKDNFYDHVVTNPPYNSTALQVSDFDMKAKAHSMDGGLLAAWVKTSTAILKSGGGFSAILRPENINELLAALENRLGDVTITPIHPKRDKPANRILVSATKGSRAPLTMAPGKILHREDGSYEDWAEDLFRGRS